MENKSILSNGLPIRFDSIDFDSGSCHNEKNLNDFTVVMGETLTLSRAEMRDLLPDSVTDEVAGVASTLGEEQARREAETLAGVRQWLEAQRSARI